MEADEPFPERMGVDQFGQLAHDLGVPTAGHGFLHPTFQRDQPELVEAGSLGDDEAEFTEVGQHLAPPERERGPEVLLVDEALEPPGVDQVRIDVEHVTTSRRAERLPRQTLAQLRDVLLERLRRSGRRAGRPRRPRRADRR